MLTPGTGDVFAEIAATARFPVQVDAALGVETVLVEAVTGHYFSLFGIDAMLGRSIGPEDDVARGGHPVVMLGHRYWRSRFGGDPDVIGRLLRIGHRAYTIVGVAPADYPGSVRGFTSALYAPTMMLDELFGIDLLEDRGSTTLLGKARLAPGVTLAQASSWWRVRGIVAARWRCDWPWAPPEARSYANC